MASGNKGFILLIRHMKTLRFIITLVYIFSSVGLPALSKVLPEIGCSIIEYHN